MLHNHRESVDEVPDTEEWDDILPKRFEGSGEYVLRYLRTFFPWHAAIVDFLKQLHGMFDIKNIDIRVVEVPYYRQEPVPVSEMTKEYSSRYPKRPEHLALLEENYSSKLEGTLHAEAMLMGLLAYFTSDQCHVSHDQNIKNAIGLEEILKPVWCLPFPLSSSSLSFRTGNW